MSERKVLNKYYPPDFDPAKIQRMPKKNRRFIIRTMCPFLMQCTLCGEYIHKGQIVYRTDLKNADYVIESGALRKRKLETGEENKKLEEVNAITILEDKIKKSNLELQRVEALEDIQNINTRNSKIDINDLLQEFRKFREEEENKTVETLLGKRKRKVAEEVIEG